MKYSPDLYASAFAAAAERATTPATQETLAKNLVRLAVQHRDAHLLPKILAAADRFVRARAGIRRVKIVSARPLPKGTAKLAGGFLKPKDAVEYAVDPGLIAGIKIIVNDEEAFDGSLQRKIGKIFTGN